ncbi:uncharacterized protein PHACADRAFT_259539 [Phanerochaete carnosa HHB-10118-sp]|uniref:NYN domain-containing protein n=1 Tax=Phanerochaete carnosa (strain HHB-10118-sp) TaxID=650164 RepID=K5W2G9_PHACS|nr:uncharacterized protein PHACADRAFT_259539 [Phanerochaete carnosa HHB-10118-sp]EKM53285.1 hypothetical protein PHACADRAFT_259539 [Phanerochaete carnosa HHB-10118-sp]
MSSALSDTTLSPAPFSPFSTYSVTTSGATSDDAPDLGAFATVFRELNHTYQNPRTNTRQLSDSGESARTPTSTFLLSDYEAPPGSTVWTQGPIADYLEHTDSEGHDQTSTEDDAEPPSINLSSVFGFLAEERAKLIAMREASTAAGRIAGHSSSTTSDGTWRHVVPTRRRRRKRKLDRSQSLHNQIRNPVNADATTEEAQDNDEEDEEEEASTSDPGAPANYYESTPASPRPKPHRRERTTTHTVPDERESRLTIHQSRSTPSLRLQATLPIDPRVLQLRNLAHKLRMLYPKDSKYLTAVLSNDQPDGSDFVDPRGPSPRPKDTPIHVFVDFSNIIIGFLIYLKRLRINRKVRHLSHAALALILERGRPVMKRVLATSSPLVQPVDSAEQMGYDVCILQRVPDDGEGTDRQHSGNSGADNARPQHIIHHTKHSKGKAPLVKGHSRKTSSISGNGGNSTESDSNGASAAHAPSPVRKRYREQGVDELLQLKLHQAIATTDDPPPGATIVLATGDGNVGQFNEEGFLGCVRLALKKGWKVELYAWEGGLSRTWKKEFGGNKKFEIYMLDRFAMDLLEL